MGRVVIPGFRKIETSSGGEGGTTNYNDLTNKPSINNVPLVGNLNTVNLKLTDVTLTEEGVPAEAKTVGTKVKEINNQIDIEQYIIDQQEYKVVDNKVVPITDIPPADYQGVSDFSDRNSKNINTIVTAHNKVVDNITELQKRISDNGYGEVAGGKNLVCAEIYGYLSTAENIHIDNASTSYIFYANKGKHYTFSSPIEPTANGGIRVGNIQNKVPKDSEVVQDYQVLADKSFIANKTGYYFVYVYNSKVENVNVQIEEGTQSTSYEPYFPSNKMLAKENTRQSTEMMDIKMLGWSVPKECPIQNEVNGNQFVQKVGRVDLGNYDYLRYDQRGFETKIIGIKNVPDGQTLPNIYCNGYRTVTSEDIWIDGDISMSDASPEKVYIMNTDYTDVVAFKSAMKGQYLYYELATYNTMTIDGNEIGETVSDVRKETTVNLLNPTLQTTTQNGVTCTNNGDGTYTLNGTATGNFESFIIGTINLIKGIKYAFCGCPKDGSNIKYRCSIWDIAECYGNTEIFEVDEDITKNISIRIEEGVTVSNITFKPMITTNLDATYDDFVPYTGDTGKLNSDVASLLKRIETLESLVNKTDITTV